MSLMNNPFENGIKFDDSRYTTDLEKAVDELLVKHATGADTGYTLKKIMHLFQQQSVGSGELRDTVKAIVAKTDDYIKFCALHNYPWPEGVNLVDELMQAIQQHEAQSNKVAALDARIAERETVKIEYYSILSPSQQMSFDIELNELQQARDAMEKKHD